MQPQKLCQTAGRKTGRISQIIFRKDKGIGYTLARTNMNSCDFSSGSYTYVDENDKDLKTFSIAHDEQFKIPFIKRVDGGS